MHSELAAIRPSTARSPRAALLLAAILLTAAGAAADAAFPERNITVVIPFNSGGGFDSYVRALAPGIEKNLPAAVTVLPKNLPGAGGRRGASDIFRARADGYTIGIFNLPGVMIPPLQGMSVGYDLSRVTWLATLGYDPYAFVVRGESPVETIGDLRELGRPVLFGATGPGSTSFIATRIVNEKLSIPHRIVTGYRGSSDYLLGVIRGDVDAAMISFSTARAYLESGDLRALAVFGADSDDPAVADAADLGVPELGRLRVVRAIGGPPGMPADIAKALEQALLAALQEPAFRDWLAASGNDVSPAGAADTAAAVNEMSEFYQRFRHLLR